MFRGYGYGIYGFLIGCFTLCTYLFCLVAIWTDRQKIVVICEDSDTNMNFARAKKQVWKQFSLISAWVNTAFIWLMWYYMWNNGLAAAGIIWGTVIYGVLFVGIAFWTIKKLLDINRTYETKRTLVDQADDDKHWLWGMIYYNKNDKHIMTESRLGTGTSVNMATKTGWITTAISIVAIAAIPFVCIWMIMLEFTPIQVNIEKDAIICEQLSVEYEISFDEIESYEIVTELPELTKVTGMGMDNVLSGTYEVYREGMYELFLNPQNGLFIKIFTEDRTYIISGADDAMTQMVLDSLETYIQ
jgi:hypothetical protein